LVRNTSVSPVTSRGEDSASRRAASALAHEILVGAAMRLGMPRIHGGLGHHPVLGLEMVGRIAHQFVEYPQQIVVRRLRGMVPRQAIEHGHQALVLVVDLAQADVEAIAPAEDVIRSGRGVHASVWRGVAILSRGGHSAPHRPARQIAGVQVLRLSSMACCRALLDVGQETHRRTSGRLK
jgi:hypothetical protein